MFVCMYVRMLQMWHPLEGKEKDLTEIEGITLTSLIVSNVSRPCLPCDMSPHDQLIWWTWTTTTKTTPKKTTKTKTTHPPKCSSKNFISIMRNSHSLLCLVEFNELIAKCNDDKTKHPKGFPVKKIFRLCGWPALNPGVHSLGLHLKIP